MHLVKHGAFIKTGLVAVSIVFAVMLPATSVAAEAATQDTDQVPNTSAPCIDGHTQQNIDYTFTDPATVTLHSLNNAPLCDDVTVEFSSYIMPSNYDGQGFYGNPTAYPQPLFSTTSAVLAAGTDGMTTLHIALPDSCNNVQTDLYYSPEIDTVGPNGHGTQNIISGVYLSTGTCVADLPNEPTTDSTAEAGTAGQGAGSIAAPQILAASTSVPTSSAQHQLSNTGVSTVLPTIAAITLLTSAFAIFSRRSRAVV